MPYMTSMVLYLERVAEALLDFDDVEALEHGLAIDR